MVWVFSLLPEDLLDKIFEYISPVIKITLSKQQFTQHHGSVVNDIPDRFYRNYLAFITKHDLAFVMSSVFSQKTNRLGKIQIYRFGGFEYETQKTYVKMLSERFNAKKIRRLLTDIELTKCPRRVKRYRKKGNYKSVNQWTS